MLAMLKKKKYKVGGNLIAWLLLFSLLIYSVTLLYTTEVYYIDSTVKASTITIDLVNITIANESEKVLTLSFNIENPQHPNLSIIVFLLGVGIYSESMNYLGSNSSYFNKLLLAGSNYSITMDITVRYLTSPLVVRTKLVFRVQTDIQQIKSISAYKQFIVNL